MTPDPYKALRARHDGTAIDAVRRRGDGSAAVFPVVVGRVFGNPTIPIASGVYVSAHPVEVLGIEAESAPGAFLVDLTRSFLAYVVGSKPPIAGDHLICRFVGDRWVAERAGKPSSGGVSLPSCACTLTPVTLHVGVSRPDSPNVILEPCTLRWGPTPAGLLPLAVGVNSYLSTQVFVDKVTLDQFRYYFTCFLNYFTLTRVYEASVYGSPYRDVIRYQWVIGSAGSSCKPFLMANGQIYAGGDLLCVVTVSE